MQLRELVLDNSLRELTVRGEPGYPLAMYDNDMDGFLSGRVPWHWHDEIELVFVYEGQMCVEAGGEVVLLHNGQGAFLNSGVLHRMFRPARSVCRMVSVVFDPRVISGAQTSLLHIKYILPVTQCSALSMVALTEEVSWQKAILEQIYRAFEAYTERGEQWEFRVRQRLTELWGLLLRENKELLQREEQNDQAQRLKKMLVYLQEHLAEPIRLEDVAGAVNVSTRECSRCFRDVLGTSPIAYLTQLRVRTAAALLECTDDSVTSIGAAVGFGSPSYFGQVFRNFTGVSPREYRNQRKTASDLTNILR